MFFAGFTNPFFCIKFLRHSRCEFNRSLLTIKYFVVCHFVHMHCSETSRKMGKGSFLLTPARPPSSPPPPTDQTYPHTIMDMRNSNKRRNVLTHARVNFSQLETCSLLRGGGGGGWVSRKDCE